MAMVLVIIGVMTGALMVGTDVLRHAKGQKAFSNFVVAWRDGFLHHHRLLGRVPEDDATNPTNMVLQAMNTWLCDPTGGDPTRLSDAFLRAGIRIPNGRGVGQHSQYIYQDSTGSPQVLQVCFATVPDWSAQGASVLAFEGRARHVMRITGLTTELAMQMDVLVDGNLSARYGQFRSSTAYSLVTVPDVGWGDVAVNPGSTEGPRRLVTAYFEIF